MASYLSRRHILTTLVALPVAGIALASCGDSGTANNATAASGATDPVTTGATAPNPQGTVDMEALLEPGTLEDKVLGEADAPVTIVEYASMTCGHCGNFHNNTLPTIKEKYIDTGQARLVLREFPFDPRAEAGAMLARCADDNYFAMSDVLFKQQNSWVPVDNAREALLRIARVGGFTQESFEACLTDQALLDEIRAVRARGQNDFGVEATPTFFINGNKYSGALSVDEMSAIIDSML
jgi:protein-disulfide isomerase